MSEFEPEGIYPALPTPISEDGTINYGASEEHIRYLEEEGGVQGVVPAGCTGHAATLGDRGGIFDEHVEYIARVSEMTDLPVIGGTGMNSTRQTIELASEVEKEADVDAHLVISPYQNCPPQDLIVEHYRILADELKEPLIAYNVPGRTGRNIEADTTMQLAEIEGVIGMKEASLDYEQIHEIGHRIQGRDDIESFNLGSGDDSANHFVFEQGGTFGISVSGNVHPEAVVEVWEKGYREQNHQAAFERNRELMPLHDAMFQAGEKNPLSVQYALNLMGFDFGTPRMPLSREPREDEEYQNQAELREVLDGFDLL